MLIELKDIKIGNKYIVITSGCNLKKGDIIWITKDGWLACKNAGGWLLKGEWEHLKNKIKEIK